LCSDATESSSAHRYRVIKQLSTGSTLPQAGVPVKDPKALGPEPRPGTHALAGRKRATGRAVHNPVACEEMVCLGL